MKKALDTIVILTLIFLSSFIASESTMGQPVEAPTWRVYDLWIYNLTIEGNPNHNYMTTYVTGEGYIFDDNGTLHPNFDVSYVQIILEDSVEYGHINVSIWDTRRVTRDNQSLVSSEETTYMRYEYGHENYTLEKIIEYDPFMDFYAFPIESGEKWNQTVNQNVSITIMNATSVSSTMYNESKTFYFHCTGTENVKVFLADYDGYFLANAPVNWTETTFTTLRIVQDDEEMDTDGTYVVVYHSEMVGNIVKREVFTDGSLNTTALLAYYEYAAGETVEDEGNGQHRGWLDKIKDILWVILLVILIIMIVLLVFFKKRKK